MFDRKWDDRFWNVALEVASWSKDPDGKVGAVLVSPDGRQVSWGYNGLPKGIADDDRLLDPDIRRLLTVHAEQNARYNCPVRPEGWHLFATKFPCATCAAMVIQSGVVRVVAPDVYKGWWHKSQVAGQAILVERGIDITIREYAS